MNYIGSKLSLLHFIDKSISKIVNDNSLVFCDLFAGTGAVGAHFKKKGYKIIANDIQYYSFVLNKNYIGNHRQLAFKKLVFQIPKLKETKLENKKDIVCRYLTNLKGIEGFIFNNYCPGGKKNKKYRRQYFSDENGKKCDAIRTQIENWKTKNLLTEGEYFFLLTSLLESIDKYANTASVYGAFLKHLKPSALKAITLKPANLVINGKSNQVFNENANTLINKIKADILYLDPPYNQRQYATNYHLLETIAKYDNPKISGKTGLRKYENQKSQYCSTREVKSAFKYLIDHANAKYIFLSYNNEGLMTSEDIKKIMCTRGDYGVFTKTHSRFKADKAKNRNYKSSETVEYLHYVVCRKL